MQLPDFGSARVLVVGDLMLDRYWHGGTSRISPEAPVPVVLVNSVEERLGGAGNVALNIATLGTLTGLIGYCGHDEAGSNLIALLQMAGIDCVVEQIHGLPTITKLRVLSRHQQLIRLDFEDRFHDVASHLLENFAGKLAEADVVVLSDYGKGTLSSIQELIRLARQADKLVLVDPKGSDFERYRGATVITPNRSEFEAVVGPCRDDAELVDKGLTLQEKLELAGLLITRGEHGMTLLQRGESPRHLPAHAKEVYDVTGAGDTVISTLAAALAAGASLEDATSLANLAAGIVVGKLGTASVALEELDYALHGQRAHCRGVIELNALLPLLGAARRNGEKIVVTNGCFDILHPGHIQYLQQARALGDRLIVLVNSDASVKRLKGNSRPVNSLEHRMTMLAALECVDWVVPFEDDTPREVIGRLLPDVLVKGGDYKDISEIAGHDYVLANGGEVKILDFIGDYSTTRIIQAIRNS
ncbi:bifunctional D-glycero-beta-D-manno-heptose-7-phosphate kinase/D-glycero-beta-D-manno-heptose 1-phosphate adenylyltransferase HldE [Methylocaldum sp.]|uniref:bifunctional D-glycero-beta-D-manno-heptose-7-phosphate kinase/D-glycero-beta-D-manno-heptose 1-phosphate adenylyltransferase HldE n=1 Tax=Methylocaldum sp. TaxID=1969727 RepID=UPI002D5151B2|nr:bifunctional D-glycero-beta-D-manno-heptose-7-phosphate kinase/D-glycero-beta-D-manno-heptose 1-phosphate adenylyltransferase HldE [Methylocaldum sp.]HYE35584.1 bifunctional D-glycero-beta-D-manno-heptose-7-phosphate kinase/D-glycero-beta-D-manno-heptose 1-phosphate adenylyltransferase HldE [Methylocaldum sp.]